MGKITKIIKKMVGKEEIINPIVDPYNYTENLNSYSGGSLEEKNILIVVSRQDTYDSVKEWACDFEAKVVVEKKENIIDIASSSATLIGPFTNIINIIYDADSQDNNSVYEVYNLLQIEINYLIEVANKGSISTAFISDKNENCKAIESLIKGLSLAIGEHGVIENGLIANKSVQLHDIFNSLSYINSKYGYILAGEVLILSEDKSNG